ncbi:hypothetical protein C5167_013688 [Papaver somniferum]|uniref:Uncharacterized protein n=1 Tax=Papaver somniferum TaxID=3469 RepID=A0A4Y7J215_PAPSO|nr:hypothetical protein C5167_013688 [Papaver somniferum]
MRTDGVSKTTNHVKKDARQETELEVNEGGGLLGKELKLGEVIWVKTNPSFLYWNPKKYRGELMEALKQNDGSSTKMFQKALQQEIVYTRSSSLKRKYSGHKEELKEKAKDGNLSDKKLKQNEDDDIHKDNSSTDCTVLKVNTRELRTRKDKGLSGKLDGTNSARTDLSLRSRKEIPKNEIPKQDEFRVGTRALRPRKAQDLPLKLEDVRQAKMKANSGDLSSGETKKKQTPKPDISRQEKEKKGQKADEEFAEKKEEESEKELSGNSPNLSSRRVRVMQSLGLAAPSDSPFKPKRLALN